MPDELDISCRCMGSDRRTRCESPATQEDGLCDPCRCPHGCCADHGDDSKWTYDLWYKDPMAYMEWFMLATQEKEQCYRTRMAELELEAE